MSLISEPYPNEGVPPSPLIDRDPVLERVRQAVRGIRYGEVRVIIQDGLIVQIKRVEKQRIR